MMEEQTTPVRLNAARILGAEKGRLARSQRSKMESSPKSTYLALTNGPSQNSRTLLSFIGEAARVTMGKGAQRHIYILTCYFDLPAVMRVTAAICQRLKHVSGKVSEITIAIDVGEWIRCRIAKEELVQKVADTANVPARLVNVVCVRIPGRLLHAKAYAAIRSKGQDKGFVVVTSGNTTQRGLGLDGASNLEIALATTDRRSLAEFARTMDELASHEMPERLALKQDEFLAALALFSSGAFYHRWPGSLSTEIRFKLTLTSKGRKARKENVRAFRDYQSDSDTISRIPINIEEVFKAHPKPFPAAFWRTYAVDTLLGYWLPSPVASVVDQKLLEDVKPYVAAIRRRTSEGRMLGVTKELRTEVSDLARSGWIKERHDAVDAWRERVDRFRANTDLIILRLHPYQRVPELLSGETRPVVLETVKALRAYLVQRTKLGPTKGIIARFLAGKLTVAQLDKEWTRLALLAAEAVEERG
jgi:hypothetical protein